MMSGMMMVLFSFKKPVAAYRLKADVKQKLHPRVFYVMYFCFSNSSFMNPHAVKCTSNFLSLLVPDSNKLLIFDLIR